MWMIKGFSQCGYRYLETSVEIKDSNTNSPLDESSTASPLVFQIRLHPQGNKDSNKDFSFFQVLSCAAAPKFNAKFSVFNTHSEEIPTTVYNGTQQLNGYFEYIRRDVLISHIQPQDEIHLMLHLNIVADTVNKSSSTITTSLAFPEPKLAELAEDIEHAFMDERYSDFTIICQGEKKSKSIKAHKVILSTRSPVFAAMLNLPTEEAKNNQVVFEDVDYDVMREMLHYMYSGSAPNLQMMAPDLMAAADRFQLQGLKEMADQVLRSSLTVDNVCRNLVLADMHNATELKADALRFTAKNSSAVIETEGWARMSKEHWRLVTDVVAAMKSDQSSLGSEPTAKRSRIDC